MAHLIITFRKRWFFKPAVYVLVVMEYLGLINADSRLTKWVADRGLVLETECSPAA